MKCPRYGCCAGSIRLDGPLPPPLAGFNRRRPRSPDTSCPGGTGTVEVSSGARPPGLFLYFRSGHPARTGCYDGVVVATSGLAEGDSMLSREERAALIDQYAAGPARLEAALARVP